MAADELSDCYRDLLKGSYDCVDRIVLNANFALCYSPGGFRSWWRTLHNGSDEDLDNAHLIRMAGRFARRVRAYAEAHRIPVRSAVGSNANMRSPNSICKNALVDSFSSW